MGITLSISCGQAVNRLLIHLEGLFFGFFIQRAFTCHHFLFHRVFRPKKLRIYTAHEGYPHINTPYGGYCGQLFYIYIFAHPERS